MSKKEQMDQNTQETEQKGTAIAKKAIENAQEEAEKKGKRIENAKKIGILVGCSLLSGFVGWLLCSKCGNHSDSSDDRSDPIVTDFVDDGESNE